MSLKVYAHKSVQREKKCDGDHLYFFHTTQGHENKKSIDEEKSNPIPKDEDCYKTIDRLKKYIQILEAEIQEEKQNIIYLQNQIIQKDQVINDQRISLRNPILSTQSMFEEISQKNEILMNENQSLTDKIRQLEIELDQRKNEISEHQGKSVAIQTNFRLLSDKNIQTTSSGCEQCQTKNLIVKQVDRFTQTSTMNIDQSKSLQMTKRHQQQIIPYFYYRVEVQLANTQKIRILPIYY